MKLKCDDNKVRRFRAATCDGQFLPDGTREDGFHDAICLECGETFGCHDTKILKPEFRKHICPEIKEAETN